MRQETLLVVAPHPDDETLGPGGTLLRRRAEGWAIHWLLATTAKGSPGFDDHTLAERDEEIAAVAAAYDFAKVHRLELPTSTLDTIPERDIYAKVSAVVTDVAPNELILPFRNDPHSDHRIISNIGWACSKSFRAPSIQRTLMYETPSETDFASDNDTFKPNYFVDITGHLNRKIEIMSIYDSEFGEHPFPRSPQGLSAKATSYGAVAGCAEAEAFMIARYIDRRGE